MFTQSEIVYWQILSFPTSFPELDCTNRVLGEEEYALMDYCLVIFSALALLLIPLNLMRPGFWAAL